MPYCLIGTQINRAIRSALFGTEEAVAVEEKHVIAYRASSLLLKQLNAEKS